MNSSFRTLLRLLTGLLVAGLLFGCSREDRSARSLERARSFFEAGDYEKAKIEYLATLQKQPSNGELFAQVGLIWSLQGSAIQANRFLMRAAELGPLPVPLRLRLVQSLMALGQVELAREQAATVLKEDPAQGEALLLLADTARSAEDADAVQGLLDQFPDKEAAYFHLAAVPSLIREGRVLAAEEAVERALAADPKSVTAHLTAGSLRLARQDLTGAEEAMRTGSALAPVRSTERLKHAEFLGRQGRGEQARALVAEVVAEAPDFLPALTLAAQLATANGDHEGALAQLGKVFAIEPEGFAARLLEADIWLAKKDPKQAVTLLRRLNEQYREQPLIRLRLARAQILEGDLAGAAALLNQLVGSRPDLAEAALLLGEVRLRTGETAAMIPSLRPLWEREGAPEQAGSLLVQALENEGRLAEAIQTTRELVSRFPGAVQYQLHLGDLLLRANQTAEARTIFEQAVAVLPDAPLALRALVDLDLADQRFDEALSRIAGLRERSPQSPLAGLLEARVHFARQDWAQAESVLTRTLELDASNSDVHDLLVRLYAGTGKPELALQTAEKLLAVSPQDARALRHAGVLAGAAGQRARSIEAYEQLLATLPSPDAMVLNNLAAAYAESAGQADRALELARRARVLRPGVEGAPTPEVRAEAAAIADTLGWIVYQRGGFAEAFTLLREAVAVLGDQGEVQYHWGMAAAAMGQSELARTALAAAAAAPAAFPGQAEAGQQLALLGGEGGRGAATSSAEIAALLAAAPDHLVLQLRLAEAWEREKNFAEAAQAYETALQRNPDLALAAQKLAVLQAGPLQDPVRALEYARRARQLLPNDAAVAGLMGGLQFQAGEHQQAYELLREAASGSGRTPETLAGLARAAYSLGKVDEARTVLQEVLAADPPAALAAEANSFLALTAPVAAGTIVDPALAAQVLPADPRNVPALMIQALAQRQRQELAAAKAGYEEILAIFPAFGPAQKELALLLADDPATHERAYELAAQARKGLPDDAELTELMGRLAYFRKDYPFAVQLFAEAARTRPPEAAALCYLGLSQVAMGAAAEGGETLARALEAGLPEPLAEAARQALAKVNP